MDGNIIKYVMFTSISAAAILFELKNLIHNSAGDILDTPWRIGNLIYSMPKS